MPARRTLLRTLLAAACLAAPVAGGAVPAHAATPPVMFGLAEPNYDRYTSTERLLGARSLLRSYFLTWGHVYANGNGFPKYEMATYYRAKYAVPVLHLGPDAQHTLRSIVSGGSDTWLKGLAQGTKGYGRPVMIRLMAEMNGTWEPYSPGHNGNTSAQYVAAWRHIVTLFRGQGATNVRWVWNPDATYNSTYSLPQFWPGASYVDWLGVDTYSRDTKTTFRFLMNSSVPAIRKVNTTLPLMVNEVGKKAAADKPTWIRDMFAALPSYGVRAVLYFDYDMRQRESCCDWRLDDTSSTTSAARAAVHRAPIVSLGTGTGHISYSDAERYVSAGHL